jgi:hypothetical protein
MFQPLQDALGAFLSYIPQLIGAAVPDPRLHHSQGAAGHRRKGIAGRRLRPLDGARGHKAVLRQGRDQPDPHSILGKLVFWFVFIVAITTATDALGIPQVSAVLAQLIAYIPNIIAAILILILAALLANFLAGIVRGANGSDVLGSIAQYAIIVYAVFAAVTQLGIAVELTAPTFLIVLGAVALAAAIAFGIGGREVARDVIEKAYNRGQEEASSAAAGESTTGGTDGGASEERPEAYRLRRDT